MAKKIESTEEPVIKTTEEIVPETKVVTEEPKLTEAPEGEVGPKIPAKEGENFKEKLERGQIVVGNKISYVVSGAKEPTEVIVDDAFLSIPIQELEYYEKFNYKIVK